ncbi:MAG: chromosome segregation protein SMC [Candidatus Eisenbacteria bacterium]
MLLDKLELFGFKSFAQRTTLRFSPGITAVVGPNGCGKSNISDAIRWALGEQNVRNLRGAQLEDVIFKGTREVKPMGLAEVALHLDNRDQRLATEYSDVLIQRRASRSGESEFRINRNPCRLKDIRDLFLDTGLGSSEYAVIEREMIDEVLADRDSARRFLLDEASGITRYKVRRKETLRKLEAVDADLVRVEDALEIEEREVRSLAYQMGKARRHRRLTERIRDLDIGLARLRWSELEATASGETGRLSEEGEQREKLRAEGHALEARQEQVRLDLLELDRNAGLARGRLSETEERLRAAREETLVLNERLRSLEDRIADRRERQATLAATRAQAETHLAGIESEIGTVRDELAARGARAREAQESWSRVDTQLRQVKEELTRKQQLHIEQIREQAASEHERQSLEGRVEQLARDLDELESQRRAFGQKLEALAGEIGSLSERRAAYEREDQEAVAERLRLEETQRSCGARAAEIGRRRAGLEGDSARLESRLHLLEEQAHSHQGYQEAVARLLAARGEIPGLIGAMAELVAIDPSWRDRLAPALRPFTEWLITASEESAWQAIAWLRKKGLGQVTLFPLELAAPAPPLAPALPEGVLTARNEEHAPLVEYLRRVVIPVEDRADVPPVAGREPGRLWVTRGGEVLSPAGWVSAGGPISEARLWQRPEENEQLRKRLAEVGEELARLRDEQGAIQGEMLAIDGRLGLLLPQGEERRAEITNLGRALAERQAEERLIREERERLALEGERLRGRQADNAAALARHREARQRSEAAESSADEGLREVAERTEALASEKDAAGKVLTERRMEELWTQTQLRDKESFQEQLIRQHAVAIEETATMEAECVAAAAQIAEGRDRLIALAREEGDLLSQRETRVQAVDRLSQERTRGEDALSSIEKELRVKRRALSDLEDLLRENEVRLARIDAEKESLRARIREQYHCDLVEIIRAEPEPVGAEESTPEAGMEFSVEAGEDPAGAAAFGSGPLGGLTPAEARERLAVLRQERERLGLVNLLAIEEHDRKREHVRFIKAQRDDLLKSKESLLAAIERINTEARRLFADTFAQVQENFGTTFGTLFPGGEARIQLSGEDPIEADIEIVARPRGKRLENIRLLSSGERALTATALLFAVYLVKPSPFCVLDELDAPLDDANVERFIALLRKFSERTQFIVITHNKLTMSVADALYGVTMQEPGISKIVSVRMEEGRLVSSDQEATRVLAQMAD